MKRTIIILCLGAFQILLSSVPDLPAGRWQDKKGEFQIAITGKNILQIQENPQSDINSFQLEVAASVRNEYWTVYAEPKNIYDSDSIVFIIEKSELTVIFYKQKKSLKTLKLYRKS